jgi:hypothetical protein
MTGCHGATGPGPFTPFANCTLQSALRANEMKRSAPASQVKLPHSWRTPSGCDRCGAPLTFHKGWWTCFTCLAAAPTDERIRSKIETALRQAKERNPMTRNQKKDLREAWTLIHEVREMLLKLEKVPGESLILRQRLADATRLIDRVETDRSP